MNYIDPRVQARPTLIVQALETVCESLELSQTQFDLAKQRYEGVGNYLARSEHPLLHNVAIYLQGSTALRTTVKPIGINEHDVDLVSHVPDQDTEVSPSALKKAIGDCLRANGNYAPLLEEMSRCWRLVYAGEFHMDITPSIKNPTCPNGGELVPDKVVKAWKASNPKGYRELFKERAKLTPIIRVRAFDEAAKASIEPYPKAGGFKGILRRIVQIAKRHRDVMFRDAPEDAPLSVIITTLASRSYAHCACNFEYDNELEFLLDVVRRMPDTIERNVSGGSLSWAIWNETTAGENFAEKWNHKPERALAFFDWHSRFVADMESLEAVIGLDRMGGKLRSLFGEHPAKAAIALLTEEVASARSNGALKVIPKVGLGTAAVATATPVRSNTFFGRKC
uniref:Nucleotidyltransferase n=1 Tax=Rhodopseudomonas palustris (strain BisA53) TaxID=316055 RepID=Q07NQ2_RHOP5